MVMHQKKMERQITEANTDVQSEDGSTVGKIMRNVDTQECVGTRSNAAWVNIRVAHKNGKHAMSRPLMSDIMSDGHKKE